MLSIKTTSLTAIRLIHSAL